MLNALQKLYEARERARNLKQKNLDLSYRNTELERRIRVLTIKAIKHDKELENALL